jgi:hypothetical protein
MGVNVFGFLTAACLVLCLPQQYHNAAYAVIQSGGSPLCALRIVSNYQLRRICGCITHVVKECF